MTRLHAVPLRALCWLDTQPTGRRLAVKASILALVAALVLYPRPLLLVRTVQRLDDPESLIDPDAVALQPWIQQVRARIEGGSTGRDSAAAGNLLPIVEAFVYEHLPYAFDWDNWGVAFYVPTVGEALARGREDCDGRAVVAASILRALGVEARLVGDFRHVWVWTPQGETMSPTGPPLTTPTPTGRRINWAVLGDALTQIAYGVAVFPLTREGILVLTGWVLAWSRRRPAACWWAVLVLLSGGLMLLRTGGAEPRQPDTLLCYAGWTAATAGAALPFLWGRFGRRPITRASYHQTCAR